MAVTVTATSSRLREAGDISSPAARFQSRFTKPAAEESGNKAAQWLMVRIQCQAVVQRCSLGVCSFTNLIGQDGAPSVRKCWLDRRSRSRDEGQQRALSGRCPQAAVQRSQVGGPSIPDPGVGRRGHARSMPRSLHGPPRDGHREVLHARRDDPRATSSGSAMNALRCQCKANSRRPLPSGRRVW